MPDREAGRIKTEDIELSKRHLPGGSLLDLQEPRREPVRCQDHRVAIASPRAFAGITVVVRCCDLGPGFDPPELQVKDLSDRAAEPLSRGAGGREPLRLLCKEQGWDQLPARSMPTPGDERHR